jgi:hypothetical protein
MKARIIGSSICSLLIVSALFPIIAFSAELNFSPASGTYEVGKDFTVKVLVNPGVDSVNAADGALTYDTDILSISSITKDASVFSLWTADPTFSNTAGTANFSGGTPTAFSKSGTVITIKFRGKKEGSGKVGFSSGSVLAADGKGTNVYTKGGEATYTIGPATAPPPRAAEPVAEPEPASDAFGGSPPVEPVITSPTHGKPENWYATSTVVMNWKIPPDVTGIRMLFSATEDGKPTVVLKPDASSSTQTQVTDGTWYFFLQFKNEAGWGAVGKRKVMIDTVLPLPFDIGILDQGDNATNPKFSMKTTDELSGMDRYEIFIGGSQTGTVKEADLVDGSYPIPAQAGGPTKVLIKAYDKAGNARESERELTLPAVTKSSKGGKGEEVVVPSFFSTERILLLLFTFIIGILSTINYYSKKNATAQKLHILSEVAQARDKNDKIFSAMREEFEQMVQDLDEKPQLTPIERDLLEKIKEVLEISEELVDTGMDELKKTIRG